MPHLTRRNALAALGAAAIVRPANAAPVPYRLDRKNSQVKFTFVLNDTAQTGTMPVDRADILIDPQNLQASTVDVSLNVAQARTGLIFATQALTGATVLDADRFPHIRFVSSRVRLGAGGRISDGASISGALTIRDKTRQMRFDAGLFRPQGSAPDDLSRLSVRLTGAISRSAFGASGFADLVDDAVLLKVDARILRA